MIKIASFAKNVSIALRIFLAANCRGYGEMRFSKLKLIKTYLRIIMVNDRLSVLATAAIEYRLCGQLKTEKFVADFGNAEAKTDWQNFFPISGKSIRPAIWLLNIYIHIIK